MPGDWPEEASWPGDDDPEGPWGAEAVMRWLAADGLHCAARSIDLLPTLADEVSQWRYQANVSRFQYAHDLYLALAALREIDPAKADEVADRTVLAALAGDSYGEWLWQWATERGLDADAIAERSRAQVRREAPDAR